MQQTQIWRRSFDAPPPPREADDPRHPGKHPELKGKVDGMSVRAPVPTGSLTDLVVTLAREVTAEEVNAAFSSAASSGPLEPYLEYADDPLVSTDIVGNGHSCIFDGLLTMAHGRTVKVFGWYDNEWGYSCRLVDVVTKLLP